LLIKAIAESTGRTLAVIKADLKKEGDLGLVAMVGVLLLRSEAKSIISSIFSTEL
jgi:hypothetical protein